MPATIITHQQVIDLVTTLPEEQLRSLYDFTLFLKQQAVVLTPESDLFGESAEEIEADEALWQEQFAASREKLRSLASETAAEFRAGRTQPMGFSATAILFLMNAANRDRARVAPGMLMHFLATSADTNGAFAMLEARGRQGMEPRPHIHSNEDESIYLLSGRIWFRIGQKEYEAGPGDLVFMPRDVQHEFKLLTEFIHVLIIISPAGFEDYFWQLTQPAESLEVPPLASTSPTAEEMALMARLNDAFGLRHPYFRMD